MVICTLNSPFCEAVVGPVKSDCKKPPIAPIISWNTLVLWSCGRYLRHNLFRGNKQVDSFEPSKTSSDVWFRNRNTFNVNKTCLQIASLDKCRQLPVGHSSGRTRRVEEVVSTLGATPLTPPYAARTACLDLGTLLQWRGRSRTL